MNRRSVMATVAAVNVVLAGFLLTHGSHRRPLALQVSSEPAPGAPSTVDDAVAPETTTSSTPTTAARAAAHQSAPTTTTVVKWDGTLNCQVRPQGEMHDQSTPYVGYAHRFGQWVVTILLHPTVQTINDHETLEVQDCATGRTKVLPGPPGHATCYQYGDIDMSLDGRSILYRCDFDRSLAHEFVMHDPVTDRIQVVPEQPDRPWLGGSLSSNGRFVVYTGHEIVWHQDTPSDVFIFDRATGATERVPRDFDGATNRDNWDRGISADGRYVGLGTSGDASRPGSGGYYRYDRQRHEFLRLPMPQIPGDIATISGDGQHFAVSGSSDATTPFGVYVLDVGADAPVRISDCATANGGYQDCMASISADGTKVTFSAWPDVPVTGTDDRTGGTYTYDRVTGTVHKDAQYPCPWDCPPSH